MSDHLDHEPTPAEAFFMPGASKLIFERAEPRPLRDDQAPDPFEEAAAACCGRCHDTGTCKSLDGDHPCRCQERRAAA